MKGAAPATRSPTSEAAPPTSATPPWRLAPLRQLCECPTGRCEQLATGLRYCDDCFFEEGSDPAECLCECAGCRPLANTAAEPAAADPGEDEAARAAAPRASPYAAPTTYQANAAYTAPPQSTRTLYGVYPGPNAVYAAPTTTAPTSPLTAAYAAYMVNYTAYVARTTYAAPTTARTTYAAPTAARTTTSGEGGTMHWGETTEERRARLLRRADRLASDRAPMTVRQAIGRIPDGWGFRRPGGWGFPQRRR